MNKESAPTAIGGFLARFLLMLLGKPELNERPIKLVKELTAEAIYLVVIPNDSLVNFPVCQGEEPDFHQRSYFAISSS